MLVPMPSQVVPSVANAVAWSVASSLRYSLSRVIEVVVDGLGVGPLTFSHRNGISVWVGKLGAVHRRA
jgi:hypothetical protein